MMGRMHRLVGTRAPWLLGAFLALAALNVLGNLLWEPLAAGTKPLLAPLLLVWALANAVAGSRPAVALMAGLFCAFLGDVLLEGGYVTYGLAAFALMQVAYLLAFRGVPGHGLVRAWPLAAIPYAAVWAVMNLVLWPHVGELRVPVLVYSALLIAMALSALDLVLRLARDVQWWPAIGGGLFVASDALLSLQLFDVAPVDSWIQAPVGDALVMAAYCAAQFLIVTGVIITLRRPQPVR